MKIRCNNIPRPVVYGYELSKTECAEFDYLNPEELESRKFVRYKGHVYDLYDFVRIDSRIAPHPQRDGWERFHGYASDSFFSGVLVRFVDEDTVLLATYLC